MIKNVIVWTLVIMALIAFWISIRSDEDQMAYTLIALGIWGVAFLVNRWAKKQEKD